VKLLQFLINYVFFISTRTALKLSTFYAINFDYVRERRPRASVAEEAAAHFGGDERDERINTRDRNGKLLILSLRSSRLASAHKLSAFASHPLSSLLE
jgi:hypothetical protein